VSRLALNEFPHDSHVFSFGLTFSQGGMR
jgi:hypothetical protein